jgi:hypothetical protein
VLILAILIIFAGVYIYENSSISGYVVDAGYNIFLSTGAGYPSSTTLDIGGTNYVIKLVSGSAMAKSATISVNGESKQITVGQSGIIGGINVTLNYVSGGGISPRVGLSVKKSSQPNQACTDSDGGKNYSVRGVVTGGSYGTVGYNHNPFTDYCNPYNQSELIEYFCSGGDSVQFNSIACSNGCSDGACMDNINNTSSLASSMDSNQKLTMDYNENINVSDVYLYSLNSYLSTYLKQVDQKISQNVNILCSWTGWNVNVSSDCTCSIPGVKSKKSCDWRGGSNTYAAYVCNCNTVSGIETYCDSGHVTQMKKYSYKTNCTAQCINCGAPVPSGPDIGSVSVGGI